MAGLTIGGKRSRKQSRGKSTRRHSKRSAKRRPSRRHSRRSTRKSNKRGKSRRRAAAKDPCREHDKDSSKCRADTENFCFYHYEEDPPTCKTEGSSEALMKRKKEVMESNRAKGFVSRREQRRKDRKSKKKGKKEQAK